MINVAVAQECAVAVRASHMTQQGFEDEDKDEAWRLGEEIRCRVCESATEATNLTNIAHRLDRAQSYPLAIVPYCTAQSNHVVIGLAQAECADCFCVIANIRSWDTPDMSERLMFRRAAVKLARSAS